MSTHSAIKYIGKAKITLLRGERVVRVIEHKNHGTAWLFKVLAYALCGEISRNDMPHYFDLGSKDSTGQFTTCLATRPYLTAKVLSATDMNSDGQIAPGGGAQFTAFIPASAVVDTTNINTLRLLSTYTGDDKLLAEIILNQDLDLGASNIYNIMLEWVMSFCNDEDAPSSAFESD